MTAPRALYKMVPTEKLKTSGDLRKRMESPHVIRLAGSLMEDGQIHDIVVDERLRIIAGRDRHAGHLINQTAKIPVKMLVDLDDEQRKRIELSENAYRRHDPSEQREAFEQLLADSRQELIEEDGFEPPPRAVRERAAEKSGTLPESIARQERRLKANGKQSESEFETWGLEVDDTWLLKVRQLGVALRALADKMQVALAASAFLDGVEDLPPAWGQDIRHQLQSVSHTIRQAIPVALCPYCKGQECQTYCPGCRTTGWVNESQVKACPPALKDRTTLMIQTDGRMVPLDVPTEETEPETDAWMT